MNQIQFRFVWQKPLKLYATFGNLDFFFKISKYVNDTDQKMHLKWIAGKSMENKNVVQSIEQGGVYILEETRTIYKGKLNF
jgi:hypothetical protein